MPLGNYKSAECLLKQGMILLCLELVQLKLSVVE